VGRTELQIRRTDGIPGVRVPINQVDIFDLPAEQEVLNEICPKSKREDVLCQIVISSQTRKSVWTFTTSKDNQQELMKILWNQKHFAALPLKEPNKLQPTKDIGLLMYSVNDSPWKCHNAAFCKTERGFNYLIIHSFTTITIPLEA